MFHRAHDSLDQSKVRNVIVQIDPAGSQVGPHPRGAERRHQAENNYADPIPRIGYWHLNAV